MLSGYYQQAQDTPGSHKSNNEGTATSTCSSVNRPMNSSSVYKSTVTSSALISASSSRMFTSYEISDEISRAKVQCLERKYGGRMRAHTAATRIQRFWRMYRLEQQFSYLLQHPGAPGRRKPQQLMPPATTSSSSSNISGDRHLYMRKLALSQPTLRYQPVTSLRAQLRAEKCSMEDSFSNQHNSQGAENFETLVHNKSPPSPRPVEPPPRPFIELMSPRLSQRRLVTISSPMQQNNQTHASPRHLSASSQRGFSSPHKKLSSPAGNVYEGQGPVVVATGVSPSVWVPRQGSEADGSAPLPEAQKQQPRNGASQNGHQLAYYTNSLPRMDRRTHSVGPHKTSNNSSEVQSLTYTAGSPSYRSMWTDQQRRRWYRIALNFFNKKPDRGLHLLINWGFVDDSPQAIAKLFLGRRGLSKQMIGEFLGTLHSPFHANVLDCFISEIDMYRMEIDVALRHMLTFFRLPGEAQKIDHIMQAFGKRYLTCNPDRLPGNVTTDTIYVIAFAIIMLNTDLHTPSIKDNKRMKVDDFIQNLRRVEGGELLTEEMLSSMYDRVKQREFKPGNDHITQVMKVDQSIVGKDKPKLVEPHRRLICYCRLHQVVDVNRRQAPNSHQREIFLFNDLILVAKIFAKKKPVAQYTLRYWTSLVGLKISTFETPLYNFGLLIQCPDGEQLFFNAKNNDDRCRFWADVKESVSESTEMESIRIEIELDKQNPQTYSLVGNRMANTGDLRDSGLPDLDHSSPIATIGTSGFLLENSTLNASTDSPSSSVKPLQNGVSLSSGCSGSNASSTSSNGTPAPVNRRLSFNSLDSGMIEEAVDLSV